MLRDAECGRSNRRFHGAGSSQDGDQAGRRLAQPVLSRGCHDPEEEIRRRARGTPPALQCPRHPVCRRLGAVPNRGEHSAAAPLRLPPSGLDTILSHPPEDRETLAEFARDLCGVLEGPPAWAWLPPELGNLDWGLFARIGGDAGKWFSGGLDESFEEAKPDGHIWGSLTTVLTLRDATDATLRRRWLVWTVSRRVGSGIAGSATPACVYLGSFPALEVLDLSKTRVTDAGVSGLRSLPNLKASTWTTRALRTRRSWWSARWGNWIR